MQKEKKSGFTLAELMAVVIIVALLAALGASYYKRAVEQSRFSEGLIAASAIVEGVNRYYLDQQLEGRTHAQILGDFNASGGFDVERLDISLPGSACGTPKNTCTSRFYTIQVISNGVVQATRSDGIYSDTTEGYFIQINPHFASVGKDLIICSPRRANSMGQAFCESMGYTTCSETACTKPQ